MPLVEVTPVSMAQPVCEVGARVRVAWPFDDGSTKSLSATVRQVQQKPPKRKRSVSSQYRYQIAFDEDGGTRDHTAPCYWTRLLHLNHTVHPAGGPPRYVPLADRLNPNRKSFDPELKARCCHCWVVLPAGSRWFICRYATLSQKARRRLIKKDEEQLERLRDREISHPFDPNPADHCETSKESYADIAPLLRLLQEKLVAKREGELRIYDPYFCAGTMKQHLGALGFHKVYNENEDFYQTIADGKVPEHDVLITNPPLRRGTHPPFARVCTCKQQALLLAPPGICARQAVFQDSCSRGQVGASPLVPTQALSLLESYR